MCCQKEFPPKDCSFVVEPSENDTVIEDQTETNSSIPMVFFNLRVDEEDITVFDQAFFVNLLFLFGGGVVIYMRNSLDFTEQN